MNPIAFKLGSFQIHWYGIMIGLAFLTGYWLTRRNARSYGWDLDLVDGLILKLFVAVIIGARLAFVINNIDYFLANPGEIIRLDHGGLGSHGAIITAFILGYYWARRAHLPFGTLTDALAPAITVGHIFVRIGNFLNGELYGPPTNMPWGVKFPTTPVPVHPSQLYEVALSLIILPFALKWSKNPRYPGYAFARVLLMHSIVRFFIDFYRQGAPLTGHLVLTQYLALGFSAVCTGFIIYKQYHNTEHTIS